MLYDVIVEHEGRQVACLGPFSRWTARKQRAIARDFYCWADYVVMKKRCH